MGLGVGAKISSYKEHATAPCSTKNRLLYLGSSGDILNNPPQISYMFMNIYTADGVAVAGADPFYANHGTLLLARSSEEYNMAEAVSAWIDGRNVALRIEPHKPDSIVTEPTRSILIKRYSNALRHADEIAKELGGRVTIELSDQSGSVTLAKLLGRLHQAESLSETGTNLIRKSIKQTASARYLYNARTGTRFLFLDDLIQFSEGLKAPEISLELAKQAFAELKLFLTCKNRIQNAEGKIFLIDKDTGKDIQDSSRSWGLDITSTITDTFTSIESCQSEDVWHAGKGQIIDQFVETLKALKIKCHPLVHAIRLDSAEFVERVSSKLKARHAGDNLGISFSTPVRPLEFGFRDTVTGSNRRFIVTTQDPRLQDIHDWLFSDVGQNKLRTLGVDIESCDYITILDPVEDLTHDPYPTRLTKKIGHIPKSSLVIELGDTLKGKSQKIIISNNPFSIENWNERVKQGASGAQDILQIVGSPFIAANLHQAYIDKQWSAFKLLLEQLNSPCIKLAAASSLTTIPKGREQGEGSSRKADFENALVGLFIDGPRVDKLPPGALTDPQQEMAMREVGTLLAASVVAHLPLQHRDIILNLERVGENSSVTLTLLKATESFCDNTNSATAKRYLETVAPLFVANHLVRWTSILLKKSPLSWTAQRQKALIEIALSSLFEGLKKLSDPAANVALADKLIEIAHPNRQALGMEDHDKIPELLDMSTYLQQSLDIIDGSGINFADFIKTIREIAHKEINIIRAVSPPAEEDQTPEEFDATTRATTAVSEIIARHIPEGGNFRIVKQWLKKIAPNSALNTYEKTWLIQLLDVNTRCEELELSADTMKSVFSRALSSTDTREDFASQIRDSSPKLNLPDETLYKFYEALRGIKGALEQQERPNKERKAIKSIIKTLRNIPDLLT